MSNEKISIIIADDHPIVRQGVRALLSAEPSFTVVGEAADGITAMHLVERLRPRVLLIDIQMPGLIGLEAIRQLRQRVPETQCIVFSMYSTDAYIQEAVKNGAAGYLLKGADASEIVKAIKIVASGTRYLCAELSERVVERFFDKASNEQIRLDDPYETLTAREREVLQLVAEGATSNDVGDRLCISPRTVEVHRANLMRKLNLKTHTDLIRFALRKGLLTID